MDGKRENLGHLGGSKKQPEKFRGIDTDLEPSQMGSSFKEITEKLGPPTAVLGGVTPYWKLANGSAIIFDSSSPRGERIALRIGPGGKHNVQSAPGIREKMIWRPEEGFVPEVAKEHSHLNDAFAGFQKLVEEGQHYREQREQERRTLQEEHMAVLMNPPADYVRPANIPAGWYEELGTLWSHWDEESGTRSQHTMWKVTNGEQTRTLGYAGPEDIQRLSWTVEPELRKELAVSPRHGMSIEERSKDPITEEELVAGLEGLELLPTTPEEILESLKNTSHSEGEPNQLMKE